MVRLLLNKIQISNEMMMQILSSYFCLVLSIIAGSYQVTGLKQACLRYCRSPLYFLIQHKLNGTSGSLNKGVFHGLFCLDRCWMLMGLLFVGSDISLFYVVGFSV